jgi:hypothetical protein
MYFYFGALMYFRSGVDTSTFLPGNGTLQPACNGSIDAGISAVVTAP